MLQGEAKGEAVRHMLELKGAIEGTDHRSLLRLRLSRNPLNSEARIYRYVISTIRKESKKCVYLSARYPVDNRPTMEAALAIDTSVYALPAEMP